ncbi:MAG: hypothetical protein LBI60_00245 [Bacteroidales bacterium]|jgi:tRNA(Arg) A34 adenosine deaminase TadA|nr:hypothetical protein [Bacteroidales bacterium]
MFYIFPLMEIPINEAIELLKKTSAGKGTCVDAIAMFVCTDGQIISASGATKKDDDPTAHAAIVLSRLNRREIKKAGPQSCMLLTEKPCPMCIVGLYQTGISRLIFLENNKIKHIDLRNDIVQNRYEEIPVL